MDLTTAILINQDPEHLLYVPDQCAN